MEASQKMRRGFLKSKLAMSLCRAAKPAKTSQTGAGSNSVGYFNDRMAMASQRVYAAKPEAVVESLVPSGDENVDAKAAGYILHVRERFKLERVDSERRRYQEMGY